jgi:hypothetical protein
MMAIRGIALVREHRLEPVNAPPESWVIRFPLAFAFIGVPRYKVAKPSSSLDLIPQGLRFRARVSGDGSRDRSVRNGIGSCMRVIEAAKLG